MQKNEFFPDGTKIDKWFYDIPVPDISSMGTQYMLTNYNILDDGMVHTKEIQNLIDTAAANGGGVIVVPRGTYLTGALFFKQGVNLYVEDGGTLKGSDNIADYPLSETRIEGETCQYFSALINANDIDGFTMFGEGTIDGNGLRSWQAFSIRLKWNPNCTNKDEQRPRLVYISNCSNVIISGLNLQNSHFWTNHIYKCHHVKFIGCNIFSPKEPVPSPSTDAIDIDVCTDVLIKNCYMEVNDDAVVLKGGKGPWADTLPENGSNERIIVENCKYGFCHSCLTCGSESIHNRNIIVRHIETDGTALMLHLKLRPDTPQHYEYILIEDMQGTVHDFVFINPWTQFYDLKDRKDIPLSYVNNITIRNCRCSCKKYFNMKCDKTQYIISDFNLENLEIYTEHNGFSTDLIDNVTIKNVNIISL